MGSVKYDWIAGTGTLLCHREASATPRMIEHPAPALQMDARLLLPQALRLLDDEYVVVEIEKPSDKILNRRGNLSAEATHAIRQALEYRDWLISNHLYVRDRFENIWRPRCLVVIGLESLLSPAQRERLRQENESRQGMVKIVGFDGLLHRSESILSNIINSGLSR
jgi:hypothetical protein